MMTLFRNENLWGYKIYKGEIVIKPMFVKARKFRNGFAAVIFSGESKWRFINYEGKDVFDMDFLEASDFNEDFAIVLTSPDKDSSGGPYHYSSLHTLNKNGRIQRGWNYNKGPKVRHSICEFKVLSNGWVYTHTSHFSGPKSVNCQTAIFDEKLNLILEKEYGLFKSDPDFLSSLFEVTDFSDGLLKIIYPNRFDFIDKRKRIVLSVSKNEYEDVADFQKGSALVKSKNDKLYFFNISKLRSETKILNRDYSYSCEDGFIIKQKDGNKIDKFGNDVPQNSSNTLKYFNNRAIVNHNIVNQFGKVIISDIEDYFFKPVELWDKIKTYTNRLGTESVIIHPNKFITEEKKNGNLFVYNENGEVIFKELNAKPIGLFSDGFLMIESSTTVVLRKFEGIDHICHISYYIDEEGKSRTLNNDDIMRYKPFSNGFALVSYSIEYIKKPNTHFSLDNRKYMYINTNFEIVASFFNHNYIFFDNSLSPFFPFSCSVAKTKLEGKVSFINSRGDIVFDASRYKQIGDSFSNDIIWATSEGHYGIIDKWRNTVLDFVCEKKLFSDDTVIIFANSLLGVIDKRGQCVMEPKYEWFELLQK